MKNSEAEFFNSHNKKVGRMLYRTLELEVEEWPGDDIRNAMERLVSLFMPGQVFEIKREVDGRPVVVDMVVGYDPAEGIPRYEVTLRGLFSAHIPPIRVMVRKPALAKEAMEQFDALYNPAAHHPDHGLIRLRIGRSPGTRRLAYGEVPVWMIRTVGKVLPDGDYEELPGEPAEASNLMRIGRLKDQDHRRQAKLTPSKIHEEVEAQKRWDQIYRNGGMPDVDDFAPRRAPALRKRLDRGLLIAIEGIDGSGTTTTMYAIKQKLREASGGVRVRATGEPTKGFHAQLLRGIMAGTYPTPLPEILLRLFVEDRKEHVKKFTPWLERGEIVILDRYYHNNAAYQRDVAPPEKILEMNAFAPEPDVVFLLVLPVEAALSRITERGEDSIATEENLAGCKAVFDMLAESEGFVKIDATLPTEAIVGRIMEVLVDKLPQV